MLSLDDSRTIDLSLTQKGDNDTDCLSGLALFRYVLEKLVIYRDTVDDLAKKFDGDSRFVYGMIDFLEDCEWVESSDNQSWKITEKGRKFLNQM